MRTLTERELDDWGYWFWNARAHAAQTCKSEHIAMLLVANYPQSLLLAWNDGKTPSEAINGLLARSYTQRMIAAAQLPR